MKLPVKKFTDTARMPERAHEDDAGLDVFVDDAINEPLWAGETRRLHVGVGVEIPAGHVGLLLPRSSTSLRGLLVHTGVIDAGFVGQLAATVTNLTRDHVPVPRGTKIAQLVLVPMVTPAVDRVEELSNTARGAGGYGSTDREKKS